ncbi:MAG: hypothetical protein OER77_00245 [Myxococcales bacterium]|nr:hypothetical protein [Myxococcales bacterium]
MDELEREYDEEEESERQRPESKRSKISEPLERARDEVDEQVLEQTKSKYTPGVEEEPEIRTMGRSGENNLRIEKVRQWVGIHLSSYYNISTAAGNEIQATVKQRAYKRGYGATGSLQTLVTPVAPIGTKGVIVVTDLTTGERLEQPWTWVPLNGPGWLSRFWKTVKGMFTND